MRHSFYIGKKYQRSVLFPRHRFLGKNKQERPCSEAKRRDACPRKTMRDEQKKAQSFSLENNCTYLQSQTDSMYFESVQNILAHTVQTSFEWTKFQFCSFVVHRRIVAKQHIIRMQDDIRIDFCCFAF